MKMGPTFGKELFDAGCADGVSWNADTGALTFGDQVTPAQKLAVQAVVAAHDASAKLPAAALPLTVDALAAALLAKGALAQADITAAKAQMP